MSIIAQLLRKRGIEVPTSGMDGPPDADLRFVFSSDCPAIETDSDGSRRLRLTEKNDQLALTTDGELVIVQGEFSQDQFDVTSKTVCARTTAKAANQLTKLRLWCAVDDGLKQAHATGKPGMPATLAEWLRQNEEEAQRLQRQVDAVGLAAEKTHDLSALVFEPGLLSEFRKRELPFKKAIAAFYVAETLRTHILTEAAKRLSRKARFDPDERDRYLARKEHLSQRAGRLYTMARDYFIQANAGSLVSRCDEMIAGYSSSAKVSAQPAPPSRSELAPTIGIFSAAHEHSSLQKLIEPVDLTLQNTVRAINGMADTKMRGNLEAHFAAHIVGIAKRLKTPTEVARLLRKVDELRGVVTAESFINAGRIDRYRGLILRERPDVLPLLGKKID